MKSSSVFMGIAAVAVVGLVGQEIAHRSSGAKSEAASADSVNGALPADWITENKLPGGKEMLGLTPSQRYAVLQVMNEKPCDCGCPHGTTAKCLVEDPQCPRAPVIFKQAIEMARTGKTAAEILAAVKQEGTPAQQQVPQGTPQRVAVPEWSPSDGPRYAKVTVVEFSDFECPYCAHLEPTLQRLRAKYPNDVRLVFRHEPLPSHLHAEGAAEAAMAANAQGKFWKMHDLLYSNQSLLDRTHFEQFAQELGLDLARFKADLDGHTFLPHIQDDARAGVGLGVTGTPALFINGRTILGAQPEENIFGIVDEEMKRATTLITQGTPLEKVYGAVMEQIPAR